MKQIIFLMLVVAVGFYIYQSWLINDQIPETVVVESNNQKDDNQESDLPKDMNDENADAENTSSSTVTFCTDLKSNVPGSASYVIMTDLAENSSISNGDSLSGCVYAPNNSYAGWAPFEGQIGYYEVVASDNTVLGQGPLPVVNTPDWMTAAMANEDLQYETTLNFDAIGYTSGKVILHNENASGEPSMDKTVEINVTF